jgi:rSAM/selenodomain-associated transferase 1
VHVLVIAKAPVPGRVKTRLCPPCTPAQAAAVAAAALHDTLEVATRCGADRRVLALDGHPGDWLPPGWRVVPQRGRGLGQRLAAAWADAGGPGVQIGMDTPQVDADLLDGAMCALDEHDAALGPAEDGGWWAIALRAARAGVFRGVPMSRPDTGVRQRRRLRALGLSVADLPTLRDVDTMDDARAVATVIPTSRFARALPA